MIKLPLPTIKTADWRRSRSSASFRLPTARLAGSAGSGIYALAQDGSITKFSYEQGLEDGVVLRILREEDGRSAFVRAGSHPYYWADGTFRRLDGLRIGPGSIFDLYERDGKLWLLQDSGIYALDKARILAGETPYATQYGTARRAHRLPAGEHLQLYGPGRQPVSGHTKRRQRV